MMDWCNTDYFIDYDEYKLNFFFDDTANKASKIVYKMQLNRFKVFKAQEEEKGHFDCALEIGTKKLYCHKFVLATASETFNALLSHRWNKTNENVIKIDNPAYTYEYFNEFLIFLYSGDCKLTNENIFVLTDMAEYYSIEYLKDSCDKFLSKMDVTTENLERMFEFAIKYSLKKFLNALISFLNSNLNAVITSPGFVSHKKSFIDLIITHKKFYFDEELFFRVVYKWAHCQAKANVATFEEEDIDGCINAELNSILPNIQFHKMSIKFLKEFVVDRNINLSLSFLYNSLLLKNDNYKEKEIAFETVYHLAEAIILKKQSKIFDPNFNVSNAVKIELSEILPNVKFHQMSFSFLMEFVFEKGFLLSPLELSLFFKSVSLCDRGSYCIDNDKSRFSCIYKLAEKQVLIKQKLSPVDDFDHTAAVRNELAEVFSNVDFARMKLDCVAEFVVGNGIFFSTEMFRDYLLKTRSTAYNNEENVFKNIYKLAKKQVIEKNKTNLIADNFNLTIAIKTELADLLPDFKFYRMSKKFLTEFVVAKKIISLEQMDHIFDVHIEIKNDDKVLIGYFEDSNGILKNLKCTETSYPRAWNKLFIGGIKLQMPSESSTVRKMKGVEWFLCLENDQGITIKHHTLISAADYLLTEMKSTSNEKFTFNTEKPAYFEAKYKNI